jgi:hypothetical protein
MAFLIIPLECCVALVHKYPRHVLGIVDVSSVSLPRVRVDVQSSDKKKYTGNKDLAYSVWELINEKIKDITNYIF